MGCLPTIFFGVRKTILVYGVLGGILIAGLKLIEYRYLLVEHSIEIYGGLVALLFSALGIWLGLRITAPRDRIVVREVQLAATIPGPFVPDLARQQDLRITPSEL